MPRVLLVFGLAALTAVVGAAHVQAQLDNVLILVADDLGVDNLSVYQEGTTPPPTPNLDALAGRGILFRNAWACALCSPSRACIMTGRYPFRTSVGFAIGVAPGMTGPLSLDEVTLPEVLDMGASGYAHAAIGKWHLGGGPLAPNKAGWSHFAGLLGHSSNYIGWPRVVNGVCATSQTYATTQIVDDALAWIGAQTTPWVCHVAFTAPHIPIHAPPPPLHTRNLSGVGSPQQNPRPYFEAMVEAMDTEIGRLLRSLGPQLARTNVIFLSDNGTSTESVLPPWDPCMAKGTPYEGGLNVPLIVAGPAVKSAPREELALVSAVDVFATVSDLAGVDARSVMPAWVQLDSVSLVPYFANPSQAPLRAEVFAEIYEGLDYSSITAAGSAAIRNARYKLLELYSPVLRENPNSPCRPFGPFPAEELYDLQQDPFELANLLAGPLSPASQQNYDALRSGMDRLRRPGGLLQTFGTPSCVGSNGNPSLGGRGTPTIGASYQIDLTAAASSRPAVLFVGQSSENWGHLSLPLDLSPLGAGPDCRLYTAPQAAMPTTTSALGFAEHTIAIPLNLKLVARSLYHSWVVLDPAAPNNNLGITTSNAAAVVIGI